MPEDILDRRPFMVSGGEIQRISMMRCLAINAKYLILDETTSMLDVSTQASIMSILSRSMDRNPKRGELLITHDIDLASVCCSRIYLMSEGRIIESGPVDDVLDGPSTEEGKEFIRSYGERH